MTHDKESLLRLLPSVDKLLGSPSLRDLASSVPRSVLLDSVRSALDETRAAILHGSFTDLSQDELLLSLLARSRSLALDAVRPHFRKAVNATGIILHTGLGRAVLPQRALQQIHDQLSGYSVLQVDPDTGKRSRRDARIEALLNLLTAAPAATVVNNNAAATMLVLNTLARSRDVIVSRGQLVEIGGSFRLPDVMAASGARLVEVGTTNKTHPRDYERAITENTAVILRVHPSNYKIVGFTAEVPLDELVRIAHAHGLVLIDDLGAGALLDFSRFGFQCGPTLPDSLAAGADLVTCSADKLIGSAQAGLILGRDDLVDRCRRNPVARMLRPDKLCLAALEATLTLFLDENVALAEVPTLRMLSRPLADLTAQARRIADALLASSPPASVSVVDGFSQMGSGSLPEQDLPTTLVSVRPSSLTPDELALRLRHHEPPVFPRIQDDAVLLDPRTLLPGDELILLHALQVALSPDAVG